MNKRKLSYIIIIIGLLFLIPFSILDYVDSSTYKIKLHRLVENDIAFSEDEGISKMSFSMELDSISADILMISQDEIVVVNVKIADGENVSDAKISHGKPFSFRNADIYLDEIPNVGDDECCLYIVYNKFKIYILIGIVFTIIGSLKLVLDSFAEIKKTKSMGDNWMTPVAFILITVLVLLLYMLFPAVRSMEIVHSKRKMFYFLHEISFFIAVLYSLYSAVFGLVEYVRGENIHRNCRLPLQLNMMLIGISVPLFMIWSKYLQGYFVTFDFRIISMLLSLIVSFVFFKINESKRLLLCILLVINMIIMLMGLVI